MDLNTRKRIENMLWSGRFVVRHVSVRGDQKHPPEIFSTDSLDQVATWLDMEGLFIVYDQKTGSVLYSTGCLNWKL